jgi:hypothetical protein
VLVDTERRVSLNCRGAAEHLSLLTPLYAIHPPHTLACASILLATRLLRIALPTNWYILFDAEWEDIWSCSGTVMVLWDSWGMQRGGASRLGKDEQIARENRWRRSWILMEDRKGVKRWLDEHALSA